MADNTMTPGGDTIRAKDRGGVKTEIIGLDLNLGGAEALATGDQANGLDVDVTRVQGTVTVSGPLTDAQLRAAALPLPSGAAQEHATAANPHSARLTDGTTYLGTTGQRLHVDDGGQSLSVDDNGGSLTVDSPQLPSALGTNGALKVEGVANGTAQPVSGPLTDAQLRASAVPVSAPTLAKGTQGATGLSVQNLKDVGRSQVMLQWHEMTGTAAVESALTNFSNGSRAAAALAAANNLAVTGGKTLRIQEIRFYIKATSTVNNIAQFRIRQAGTVANNSPIIWGASLALPLGTVAAGAFQEQVVSIPDGLEVPAGQQITFTWLTAAATCTVGLALTGFEY